MDFSISKRAQDLRQRAREFVKREAMPLEPRLTGLSAKDRQLMAEHEDLEFLRPFLPTEEKDQLQEPAHDNVQR